MKNNEHVADAPVADEAGRLEALRRLAVLDTLPDPIFDAITAAASQACRSPIALVSLIDAGRQWFKSNLGLPGVDETPREVAFCDHAIRGDGLFEIADARLDPRFAENPLVCGEPRIRFYAGAPIVLPGGERVGTVCVIDREPRELSEQQRATLMSLSVIAGAALEAAGRQAAMRLELATTEARYRAIVEDQSELISLAGRDRVITFVNTAYAKHFGLEPHRMLGHDLLDFVAEADRDEVRRHWDAVCSQAAPVTGTNRMRSARGVDRWVAWTNRPLLDAAGAVTMVQSVGRDMTEQRSVELALAASERRYRSLYKATPAILHSLDDEGRLIDVSDQWLEVMGYESDQVLGRRSTEFLTPESQRKAVDQVLPDFFRTGRCEGVAYQFVRKDGSLIDIELSATLERDDNGKPLRSLAVLRDVTETNRLALELSRTHDRLDAIVENVPAMLAYWGADCTTHFVNREFQAAIGLPLESIVGRPLREVVDAVDPMATLTLAPHVERVLEGRRQEFELAMLTTAGLRQMRATLIPDQPQIGRINGFYGVALDITGLKALELRLSDSEQRYRSLFDHLNSGFALHEIVTSADGRAVDYRFLALNAAFSAMTGLMPESTLGRRVTEVLPDIQNDPADWIGVFGRVALTGEPKHFEQRSAGMGQWFDVVAYRPAPRQFAVIAIDITKRKAAEAGLREAFKEKETLLKEVYHRVKNNLQVVQSLLNLQRRSVPDVVARSALDDSVQRIRAMALVHEKLYQSGSLSAISLPDYIEDLLKQIGEATGAAQRQIAMRAEIMPLEIGLDAAIPFGLLVAELVTNALKHGFPAGTPGAVLIELREQQDIVILSVADDGIGLPADFDLAHCDSMGLQLATSLARQVGGELQASAGRCGGTVFNVLLTRSSIS